ncbi:MAG TPA: hypothetical protein VF192_08645 [Longimicrobiales bacterium]
MMESNDPSREEASRPLPPVFSRLAVTQSGLADGAPAGPYFGPHRPAARALGRTTASAEPVVAARAPGEHAAPTELAHGRWERAVAGATPIADRTAALAMPLPTEPDDARAAASPLADPAAGHRTAQDGRGAAPAARLAEEVAERLERLALRLRTEGDPRLAIAARADDDLDAVIARVVSDHLTRDLGA